MQNDNTLKENLSSHLYHALAFDMSQTIKTRSHLIGMYTFSPYSYLQDITHLRPGCGCGCESLFSLFTLLSTPTPPYEIK
jgi:hypothetical protein